MKYLLIIAVLTAVSATSFAGKHPKKKPVAADDHRFIVEDSVLAAIPRLEKNGAWQYPITNMWDDAVRKARVSHRPVIVFDVDFVDSASIGFRDRVLKDPNVLVYLFENFEVAINDFSVDPPPSVGFDSLRNLGLRLDALEKNYAIAVRPTAILLRSDSSEIERISYPNLLTGVGLINKIQAYLAGINTVQSLRNRFWRDTTNIRSRIAYLTRLTERSEYDSVVYQLGVIAAMKPPPDDYKDAPKQYAYLRMNVEGNSSYLKQWVSAQPKTGDDSVQALQGLRDLLEFYQARKKIDSIATYYEQIMSYSGVRDPDVLNNYAWDLANFSKRWDDALVISNEAIAGKPKSADYYDTRALIQWSRKDYADAAHDAASAVRLAKGKDDKKYFNERLQFYKKQLSDSHNASSSDAPPTK